MPQGMGTARKDSSDRVEGDVRSEEGRMTAMECRRVFVAEPSSIPAARMWAAGHLAGVGVRPDTVERAKLLVSELTGNVVRHTTSEQFVVSLDIRNGIEVGVHDQDPIARPEARREPHPLDLSGRGLIVITNVADAWTVEPTSTGKWVRVLIDDRSPG
jgi:anti-sigma regulatory factor (Ser/Thr protein kinase)